MQKYEQVWEKWNFKYEIMASTFNVNAIPISYYVYAQFITIS